MTSRERVATALDHREPDRVPIDLGSCGVTGMHVSCVYALRQSLGLDPPGTPVKVVETYQVLGEIAPDLQDALGVDVTGLGIPSTMFGYRLEDWKEWKTFDGTPVLVPGGFNTDPEPNGDILQYPEGDRSAPPSGRMPKDGFFFDAIIRQPPVDDAKLDPADNTEEFVPISDEDLDLLRRESVRLEKETEKAVHFKLGGTAFGDIAMVPAAWLRNPKGIRDVEEWYVSTVARRDYVYAVFERQCEIALENLAKAKEAVGDRVSHFYLSGTDFGMQTGPLSSPATYRDLYKPFHKQVANWVHKNTSWKVFMHSCGSIVALLDDIVEAGIDILNPVQCSATGMDPTTLKKKYGKRLVFWGGGVDTQKTLPFGTPEQVREEVRERLRIFSPGGGYVFNAIHNVQYGTPVENIRAMFSTVREFGCY